MKDLTQYETEALNDYCQSLERWLIDDSFNDDYRIISNLITDIKTEIRDRKIIQLICEK